MIYCFAGNATDPELHRFGVELGTALERAGFTKTNELHEAALVLNLIDADDPKPFRRRSRGTFAAAIHVKQEVPEDILRLNYPLLVRALANQVAVYVPDEGVWFTTPERGHYGELADGDISSLAERVIARLVPLATARLVIDNEYRTDLEPELWDGDEVTEDVSAAGARLGELALLPAPFPVEELLDERDLRQVKRLYGIGGCPTATSRRARTKPASG